MNPALTEAHLWAALAAPFGAFFAVQSASRLVIAGGVIDTPRTNVDCRIAAVAAGAVFLAAWTAPSSLQAVGDAIFLCGLCHLAIVDLRWLAAPVRLCLVLVAAGIAFALFETGATGALASGATAFAGWASYRLLDLVYLRLRGRVGLGSGDALAAAVIGAWLGIQGLAWATALGGALTLFAARRGKIHSREPLPLIPGLTLAAFVVVLVGRWM